MRLSRTDMTLRQTASDPEPFRITAGAEDAGQRVDRFVAGAIGTLSRSRVKTLIEESRLTANGRTVHEPADPVRAGITYVLDVPPPAPAAPRAQVIPFPILFEDDDLIVLDKPAGLVVHPAPGNPDGTLVNALLAHVWTAPTWPWFGACRRRCKARSRAPSAATSGTASGWRWSAAAAKRR